MNYFIYVMVIQSSVLIVILGQDIFFVYPNHEWTHHFNIKFWNNIINNYIVRIILYDLHVLNAGPTWWTTYYVP
jgi:hypothetical protein